MTSTSYVYSSLVQDDSRRVVGSAAINAPVPDLSVGDVQVTDHVALRCDDLADPVAAVLHDGILVQCPGDRGQGSPLHVAHQGHRLSWAHHFLAEGRDDFGSSVCQGKEKQENSAYLHSVKLVPSILDYIP